MNVRATGRGAAQRGSLLQRGRVAIVMAASWLACRLPEGAMAWVAAVLGQVWYLITPGRAAQARRNLDRVVKDLAARHPTAGQVGTDPAGGLDPRIRAAAHDPKVLEALVRSAYRHAVRYYLDMIRVPVLGERLLRDRLVIETPDVVERAFGAGRPVIFVGLHFGAIELPALYLARRTGRISTVPMETLADPALQAWMIRTRSRAKLRIVGLAEARRELGAALDRGESIGLIADRDLTGNGVATRLFGAPARLPAGPALLAIDRDAPVFVAAVRRTADGAWRGRLREVTVPPEGPRRERIARVVDGIASAFEDAVALAPDQWWTVFYPIWDDPPGGPNDQDGRVAVAAEVGGRSVGS
jgi:KDO2-lipid IV(A) lauroyltransferase